MHPNEHCNCRYADVGCDRMEQVMDQISGKWKMRILFMVGAHGTLRYGELRKLLDGVTHKMLSNQLKELAADGLVQPHCQAETAQPQQSDRLLRRCRREQMPTYCCPVRAARQPGLFDPQ